MSRLVSYPSGSPTSRYLAMSQGGCSLLSTHNRHVDTHTVPSHFVLSRARSCLVVIYFAFTCGTLVLLVYCIACVVYENYKRVCLFYSPACARVPPSRSEASRCPCRVPGGPLPVTRLSLRPSVRATAAPSLAFHIAPILSGPKNRLSSSSRYHRSGTNLALHPLDFLTRITE